ncbi:unnamed protein product [Kluyveromyces dobzhanskii CBS 2104]|uniref:1-(5-phosphoribosyl)-5-[(5-phosphoribosylamino)methylideneamino] imidazole-4-carboxamide isomerase n=1 Tax=Kluyveromyces dobzhanskii CBS 2104 TaxID=1427455 RepID=A0A0A8L4Z2_9SACH|nr:unnamed protein product [Kluyveromyces dobzhanskii CBS 2104]
MTKFVGCIDLHDGQVKQIVGGTLTDSSNDKVTTNFVSKLPPSHYAKLYFENKVNGCHVIKLGPNNDDAALESLKQCPNFLQVGGGITPENCEYWLQYASKVIVTSYLFDKTTYQFQREKLSKLAEICGKDRLVVDLSCRRVVRDESDGSVQEPRWVVAMNKWQTLTDLELNEKTFLELCQYTDEFLIHAADVEGLCNGIDEELVAHLYQWTAELPDVKIVYAGGAKSVADLRTVEKLSHGRIDLTFGSSLDIFGGSLVKFQDCVQWNLER